ncbi:MAG: FHA domain-containing serine/threonine-protein kinase [Tepidisphaeraceae bacterium]|jgi:serine/threonine protein kinase
MTDVTDESGKSSTLSDLTLEVRQSGVADQEVFLQHGLSLGRNPSNTLCINHPDVERIHAQVQRQPDGAMLLECASSTAQITLPDGKKAHELVLKPGTTFKIGPATIRCLKRQTKPAVVVTDNPWQVRCPRCHEVVAELSHDARKCPSCKTELFYFREKAAKDQPEDSVFQGWLPRMIGPYHVRAFVAQGGMGIVLRGLHQDNDMPAAVKLLKGDPDHDPVWKARFEAEISTLTSLKHPNVVRLQAHGRDEKLLWLAMDWIDGVPLASWIAKSRGEQALLPIEQIRSAMSQVVSGLQYLHARQIIHRDLKPSNILVAQDDSVKMVDFGIARASSGNTAMATRLTQTGMVTGTESYMAPEQAEGRTVTPASDIYSLGVIWYELLTGRRPMGAFVSPELARPDTPPAWSRAIGQCLSVDARSRPALDELLRVLSGMPSPPPIPAAVPGMPLPPVSAPPWTAAPPTAPVAPRVPPTPPPYSGYPQQPPAGGTPAAGFGAAVKPLLQQAAATAGRLANRGSAALAAFFRANPPSQWLQKLGPLGQTIRKNPKIWIAGGAVAGLLLVILMIRGLSESPSKTGDHNNPAANNPTNNPAAAGQNPLAVNPAQQHAPPAPDPQQMAMLEEQAYEQAVRRMSQTVMYARFYPFGNPNVSVTPQSDGSFLVRAVCNGLFPGRGYTTLPFACVVHRAPDGTWTTDNPQY